MSATTAQVIWAVVLAGGASLSFLYAGLETGIYAMNKIRLELRADSGRPSALALGRHLRNYRRFLSVLLIGQNIANYAATSAITALFVLGGYREHVAWYTEAVAAPLLFVFCESLPKNLFQRLSERLVYRMVWLLDASTAVFKWTGLAALVGGGSSLLLRAAGVRDARSASLAHIGVQRIVSEGWASGVLTHVQSVMADRVMHIRDVHLRDVMIPMAQVRRAPASASRKDVIEALRHHNSSRIPLLSDAGQVVGIADAYEVLLGGDEVSLTQKATAPLVLPAGRLVTEALYQMQKSRQAMAIVADDAGRHVGIVTIKDLVEEIVGDLEAW